MVAPPVSPVLRARYERRRAEVLAAAARVFAERGFHATSMTDLVRATGLTAGGLYHYIPSKDALLVEICDELMRPLLVRAREIAASELPAEQQLQELLRAWLVHVEQYRHHVLVFSQERHVLARGGRWRQVRRARKDFEQILAGVLERAERQGILRSPDRALTLRALLGMVNHTALWFRPRGRLSAEQIADGYLDLLLTRGPADGQ